MRARTGACVSLCLGVLAALLFLLGGSSASAAAATRAPSLGPPPTEVGVLECTGISSGHCISDVWPGRFDFKVSPHVVRVGQVIGASVTDGTDGYGHSWSWGTAPGGYFGTGKVQPGCSPPMGTWIKGPSGGHCSWKMSVATNAWVAASACINPLGQVYCDEDYYAVLDNRYLLHGYVRDANGKGVGGVRITMTGAGQNLYTVSGAGGYYDAELKRGTYSVGASKAGLKLCAAQRTKCENPTSLNVVTDKELDFGPPSGVVVTGYVRDHRGKALAGVTVEAVATKDGARTTATTDSSGAYRLELVGGAYNVRPVLTRKTDRERYVPSSSYVQRTTGSVTEDFQLAPGDELDLATTISRLISGLWWTTVTASGSASTDGSVTLENGRADPVGGEAVTIDAPYWDVAPAGSSAPELVICDDSWQRVYPGGGFTRSTNAQGSVAFHMFFGGVLGNFYIHSRERSDVTVLDVERFGQTGRVVGVSHDEILMALKTNQGYGVSPTTGKTPAELQAGIMAWLLQRRAGLVGPDAQSPFGEFAPIKNAAGTIGGVIFYPSGDPLPLRQHLLNGTPLPAGYETRVLRITGLGVLGASPIYNGLPTLAEWERVFGQARYGYLAEPSSQSLVFLGFPYPPAATDPQRASFDRCVPGTNLFTVVQVHSPLRVSFSSQGRVFSVDGAGRITRNQLAGTFVKGRSGNADTYILPAGAYTATLTGTGSGQASLVVTSPARTGDTVQTFTMPSRTGATGTLAIKRTGAAPTLRFGGKTVRARSGVALRVGGLPKSLRAGSRARLSLRVTSQFGKPVAGAAVTVTGKGLNRRVVTGARGGATLTFVVPRSGRVQLRVAMPGYATTAKTIKLVTHR